jgi:hypothetical protein
MDNSLLVDYFQDATPTLAGQVERISDAIETYGNIPKFFGAFYKPIGLEYEVESCNIGSGNNPAPVSSPNGKIFQFWTVIKDGSLRNSGVEFVSKPVVGHGIDYALHEMDKILELSGPVSSSIRTSIHVHVDMSTWRIHELFYLPALYALFEEPFFSMHYRITQILPKTSSVVDGMKYCALNLAPVARQLTVEFRHADFSTDLRKNRRWIQVVCKFMKFAEENKESLKKIVTDTVATGDYLKLFHRVMGKSVQLFDLHSVPDMMRANAPWAIATVESF